jgi:hypothetical protein
MTISEFIYGFDEGSTYAEYDEQGNVYIYDNTYDSMMAQLGIDSSVWEVEDDSFVMSSSLLRLMAELADTPPAKRRVTPKYVILNGMPRYGMCYYFSVDCDEGQLITGCVIGASIEGCASFSKERLCEAKKALTPELAAAIDMMTVSLECAIELTEKSRHDDLD